MTAHYVYRCYGADGRLLYVGQTKNHVNRMRQHRLTAFWAHEVVKVKVTTHSGSELARKIERHAIRNERPRFNVQGRWESRSTWTKDDYLDFTRAVFEGHSTSVTRTRLELIFRLYQENIGEKHPAADHIRSELDKVQAQTVIQMASQKADNEARSRRIHLEDKQGMYAHLAFCDTCALAGDYAVDCPEILTDEEEGWLTPVKGSVTA